MCDLQMPVLLVHFPETLYYVYPARLHLKILLSWRPGSPALPNVLGNPSSIKEGHFVEQTHCNAVTNGGLHFPCDWVVGGSIW